MSARSLGRAVRLSAVVNGAPVAAEVPTSRVLSAFIRDELGLKGTKVACARGVCGACTVLIDGVPRASCSAFAFEADGAEITTIEGIGAPGRPDPVQAAFARLSAFQCGYCTSGMIVLARGLLARNPDPTRADVRHWISSGICRCTGYALIVEAVIEAAAELRAQG